MPDRVDMHVDEWLRDAGVRVAVERFMRRQADRVREQIRADAETPQKTGELKRAMRNRVGYDRLGPYAFISTRARNPETGYRYALALDQKKKYMERGLRRTPRE